MASYFNLILDTTAPSSCSISCANSVYNTRSIVVALAATGATQMKVYGDIGSGSTATGEAAANWETYSASKTVTLTSGDGTKTIKAKFRDSVGNESAAVIVTIALDTTAVVVTITGPDVSTISKVSGYDSCSFSFSANDAFVEYIVKVVPSNSSLHTSGVAIGTTNGSTNMSGSGTYAASTAISCTINGADLENASAGDGAKIIKVFAKDANGNWSV